MSSAMDVHAHYYPTDYLELLRRNGVNTVVGDDPLGGPAGLAERLRMMDAAKIGRQIVGVGPLFPSLPDSAEAIAGARMANAGLQHLAEQHPDRFRVFAALPLPHLDAAIDEVDRLSGIPSILGWTLGPTVLDRPITDPVFFPVFEKLNEADATVFVHPVGSAMQFYPTTPDLTWLVGAVFEDTAVAVDMALSGWAARFPRVKVIIPHLGGALPFILQRLDDQYLRRNPGATSPRSLLQKMWFDTVNSDSAALQLCGDRLGFDRIMLGTDFPFLPGAMFTQSVEYVDALAAPTRDAVRFGNAEGLLNAGR